MIEALGHPLFYVCFWLLLGGTGLYHLAKIAVNLERTIETLDIVIKELRKIK